MGGSILQVQHVSKIYPGTKTYALDDVSLTVNQGEVLALLGVNGAGKTTLSTIIATLHPPTSGDVLFKGISIYKNLMDYRRVLGYCPQRANLDGFLNVQDNLIFAGRYFLMPHDQIIERTRQLMDQFGLNKYARFNINALSGGYKQRVSIARALMHHPEIVIFDEPTVGLDPDIRRQLWDVIEQLKAQGITIILTTHYLDEAEALSDRACIMHRGKILLIETIGHIKEQRKKEIFEDIFIDLTRREENRS